jgi:hypothetical protein
VDYVEFLVVQLLDLTSSAVLECVALELEEGLDVVVV